MKYKNGREAKLHDPIIGVDVSGRAIQGVLYRINKSTGNGHSQSETEANIFVRLNECLHAEDAE